MEAVMYIFKKNYNDPYHTEVETKRADMTAQYILESIIIPLTTDQGQFIRTHRCQMDSLRN